MRMFSKTQRCALFLMVFLLASTGIAQEISITPYAKLQMEKQKEVVVSAFSPDGRFLLTGDKRGYIQCWYLERKMPITTLRLRGTLIFLSFLSENKKLVAISKFGRVAVMDLVAKKTLATFKSKGRPRQIALDAGKRYLAIANAKERIEIFDLKAPMPVGVIDARGKIKDILFLGFDRLGEQLVAITSDAKAMSWNPSTQHLIREVSLNSDELHGSRSVIHAAATNRASNIFVVGLQEVAASSTGDVQVITKPASSQIMSEQRMLTRSAELIRHNLVIVFDWNTGMEIKRVKTNWRIDEIVLGPGNDHVAVINNADNNIALIDLRKGELGSRVAMPIKPKTLAVAETNQWLAAGAEKGNITVWSLKFREAPSAGTLASRLPSLSGRIRTAQANTEPALPPNFPVTLAILPFQAKGISQDVADLCVDLMASSLANFRYITLVERNRIQEVIKELELQMTGLTEQNGSEIGKILNADRVILGSIGILGTSYIFNARILDVETARVTNGRQVICEECRSQDIYDAVNVLISTLAR